MKNVENHCFETTTPEVVLQNLRAYKTWILSN